MDIKGHMCFKKQFTDGCSLSSVHTVVFTDGDTHGDMQVTVYYM